MTESSSPRVAIVPGSDSGIGRATAVALAEQGCDVGVTWYQDEADGKATAELVRAAGRRGGARGARLTPLARPPGGASRRAHGRSPAPPTTSLAAFRW